MKRLRYRLELLEPALLTAPGGDPNTDESVDYIPGSVLRGALAHKFKQAGLSDAMFTRLFLDDTTRFFNAYLAMEDERMLPTPAHWRREKDPHDPQKAYPVHDLTKQMLPAQKGVGKSFMRVENGIVHTQQPQYEVAVHNARNREMGRAIRNDETNRSALFRYHALAARQKFVGHILLADGDVETIKQLLASGDFWLGGSSSAGYGRSQISSVQEQTANGWREMNITPTDIPANTPFFVYLTSDAIVRDPKTGQHGAFLYKQLAGLLSGHRLTVLHGYGRFGWVGGFNRHWGLPLPQTWSMLKGSVWQMKSDQPITAADIQRIEQRGIGDRRVEGFGALLVLPTDAWPQNLHVATQQTPLKPTRNELEFPELSKDSANLLAQMNRRIVTQQLDRRLLAALHGDKKMSTAGLRRLSNSQLARLRLKIWQELDKPDDEFKQFCKFLNGTADRKSADDQYRKCRFQGRDFRNWLQALAANPEQVWEIIGLKKMDGKWQRPLLGKEPFPLSDKLAHEYTVRLIAAICDKAAKERRSS